MLPYLLLLCFHVTFFRRFYVENPYLHARGEPLDTEFPSWRFLGEWLRREGLLATHVADPYYWPDYAGLPILATFYPLHRLGAWIGAQWSLDAAWRLFQHVMWAHFVAASWGIYALFSSMGYGVVASFFGAVTCTYLVYAIKQNCAIVYTVAWLPLFLLGMRFHLSAVAGGALGMALLAGYWPLVWPTSLLGIMAWLWWG